MKFNTRELVTLAVFGVLWGVVEISFGSVLKSLNIPLSGIVLSMVGLTIAMIGRILVPRKGATLFLGVIACLLKLFSLGGVLIGPMVGILSEAIIAEAMLSLTGKPERYTFILAGTLGVTWCLLQPFVTNPLLFGRYMMIAWLDMLDKGSQLLRLDSSAAWLIVLIMLSIHLLMGALTGWFAWNVGKQIQDRMSGTTLEVAHS